MIENAQALFGQDIIDIFSSLSLDEEMQQQQQQRQQRQQQQEEIKSVDVATKMVLINSAPKKGNESHPTSPPRHQHGIHSFIDDVDGSGIIVDDSTQIKTQNGGLTVMPLKEMNDECQSSPSPQNQAQHGQQLQRQQIVVANRLQCSNYNENPGDSECNMVNSNNNNNRSLDDDNSTTTSILIVNHHPPKRQSHVEENRHRPLSATESTSSSRASSSTSGVHSESPAFSSEVDSHNTRTTNTTSSSPSPSTVSSPSSVTSSSPTSPVQCETDSHHQTSVVAVEPDHQRKSSSHLICSNRLTDSETNLDNEHTNSFNSSKAHLTECQPTMRKLLVNSSSSVDQTTSVRYQNRHMINSRYSTYMGILNRVPKIPVQLTTSNYGGEAIIYNPKPQRNSVDNQQVQHYANVQMTSPQTSISNTTKTTHEQQVVDHHQLPVECSVQKDSVISVKPVTVTTAAIQKQQQEKEQQQQQYRSISTKAQQELREQRLNEFLAHQHHPLVSTPSLPFLPQSNNYNAILRQQQHHPIVSQHHQAANIANNISYLQNHHHFQQQHAPLFYSTTNLSSMQQHQHYQQDRYLLHHRTSLEPQRSHVMLLRDYYLSLEQQNQQQHQHRLLRESMPHRQQQQQQQPFSQAQSTIILNGLTTHQAIHRPQPRLAKIRQNQFSGVYVKNTSQQPSMAVVTNTNTSRATPPMTIQESLV